jgi:hypothetical protein
VVWMMFLPRQARLICFCIVTPWEIGVILTANYTFLNYLVLALGFLLLDDRSVRGWLPRRVREELPEWKEEDEPRGDEVLSIVKASVDSDGETAEIPQDQARRGGWMRVAGVGVSAVALSWIGYATTLELIQMAWRDVPLPSLPETVLEPWRIANQYGLFAMMTRGRYEIEFQGSQDGENWTPYLFRYKPQALNEAPGLYAPYQPRFEWNLWFASLGDWHENDMVPLTEERLLENDRDVLGLFRSNPFPQAPPRFVKAVLWQYWFTSMDEKRRTGNWWKREWKGLYAPELTKQPDGKFAVVEWPEELPPHD